DVDPDPAPLALQYLLDQFASTVASSRHQLEREVLAIEVAPDPARLGVPTRGVKKARGARRVIFIPRRLGAISGIERIDEAVRHLLATAEQRIGDRLSVEPDDQSL